MTLNQAFQILKSASDSHSARIVLGAIIGADIIAGKNRDSAQDIAPMQRIGIYRAARQLRRGVPVAKIIHKKWFYGLPFYTNAHTLDPRPDSETLVSAVLENQTNMAGPKILDMGTGTGCLICAIVKNLPNARGVGMDISRGARVVARRNVRMLGLSDRIKIVRGNFASLFSFFVSRFLPFDIIISNPPYIARGDTRVDSGAQHDPACALYAGADGLSAYRAIAKNVRVLLRRGGRIYLEIGDGQGDQVREIFSAAGWQFIESHNDLAGIERVMVFQLTTNK